MGVGHYCTQTWDIQFAYKYRSMLRSLYAKIVGSDEPVPTPQEVRLGTLNRQLMTVSRALREATEMHAGVVKNMEVMLAAGQEKLAEVNAKIAEQLKSSEEACAVRMEVVNIEMKLMSDLEQKHDTLKEKVDDARAELQALRSEAKMQKRKNIAAHKRSAAKVLKEADDLLEPVKKRRVEEVSDLESEEEEDRYLRAF